MSNYIDAYQETIPKVRKHQSKLGAKMCFRVKFVEIEVMIDSCRKWYGEFDKKEGIARVALTYI